MHEVMARRILGLCGCHDQENLSLLWISSQCRCACHVDVTTLRTCNVDTHLKTDDKANSSSYTACGSYSHLPVDVKPSVCSEESLPCLAGVSRKLQPMQKVFQLKEGPHLQDPDPFSRIPKHDAGHTPKRSSRFYVSGLQSLMDQAI